jgi:hypothetical protein
MGNTIYRTSKNPTNFISIEKAKQIKDKTQKNPLNGLIEKEEFAQAHPAKMVLWIILKKKYRDTGRCEWYFLDKLYRLLYFKGYTPRQCVKRTHATLRRIKNTIKRFEKEGELWAEEVQMLINCPQYVRGKQI